MREGLACRTRGRDQDFDLAAALCSRNASFKTAERPFSAQELANVLLGDEHRRVTGAVRVALMKQAETDFDAELSDTEEQST